jgi:hypothetical protein
VSRRGSSLQRKALTSHVALDRSTRPPPASGLSVSARCCSPSFPSQLERSHRCLAPVNIFPAPDMRPNVRSFPFHPRPHSAHAASAHASHRTRCQGWPIRRLSPGCLTEPAERSVVPVPSACSQRARTSPRLRLFQARTAGREFSGTPGSVAPARFPPCGSGLRRFGTRRLTPLRHTPGGKSYSRPGLSQKFGRNDVAGYLKRSAKKEIRRRF